MTARLVMLCLIAALLLPASAQAQTRRDSLKNGAIIGALVGGITAALMGTYACHYLAEEGDPSCWQGVAVFSAVGAGVGVAAGVGIDAMRSPQPGFRGVSFVWRHRF